MYTIIIEYCVGKQLYQETVNALSETRSKGIVIIGRDSSTCDLVLNDITKTVSRQHIEIYFDNQNYSLRLRNLTGNRHQPNITIVDGQCIVNQSIEVKTGSKIQLGQVFLNVKEVKILSQKQPKEKVYGVKCINGHQVSLNYLKDFCPYCGVSLQSSKTIYLK